MRSLTDITTALSVPQSSTADIAEITLAGVVQLRQCSDYSLASPYFLWLQSQANTETKRQLPLHTRLFIISSQTRQLDWTGM